MLNKYPPQAGSQTNGWKAERLPYNFQDPEYFLADGFGSGKSICNDFQSLRQDLLSCLNRIAASFCITGGG
jgi:hypothetical protein